jgi:CheY-like chemotaxis protein
LFEGLFRAFLLRDIEETLEQITMSVQFDRPHRFDNGTPFTPGGQKNAFGLVHGLCEIGDRAVSRFRRTHIMMTNRADRLLERRWEMEFALGGEEALRMCQKTAFDVVVSDMRMPGMDGGTLLTRLRDLSPGTGALPGIHGSSSMRVECKCPMPTAGDCSSLCFHQHPQDIE